MGVDVWEAVEAAATKPFGFMPFFPGPGVGGDCIPVSPVYLSWRARDVGSEMPLVDMARHYNEGAPDRLAAQIAGLINKSGKSTDTGRVLLVGITYKKDVEDTRESPALYLLNQLKTMGVGAVDYHDPYFPNMPVTRDHPDLAGMTSVDLTPEVLSSYDVVVITTDHDVVDYERIAQEAHQIVDTRNVFAKKSVAVSGNKLVKL
jgi:UDP-N-acetyl-D-glucosamine dehydrogenase